MADSWLVVGCGSIGQRHIQNLRALGIVELQAYDPLPERRAQAGAHGAKPVDDLTEGLARSPQAVLICTPPHQHTALAQRALTAGAHVFVEKPIAHSLEGLEDLLAAAREQKRILCVGYNWRFHAALRKVKELLEVGVVGRLLLMRAEVGQYLPDWRPAQDYRSGYNVKTAMGGGIILDASHELDYVRWLGGEVESVFCVAGHLSELQMDAEDTAAIILRMANGVIAEVHLDCVQRAYARNCKMVGSLGTIAWDFSDGVRLYLGESKTWEHFPIKPESNAMYLDEMQHFIDCVRGAASPLVDGLAGRRVLEIALAARQSAASGQLVRL